MKTDSILLLGLLVCLCFPGCAFLRDQFSRRDAAPPAQPWTRHATPTLEQIIQAVNQNSQSIRNFTSDNASISLPNVIIPLHSRISFERPLRLRMHGSAMSFGSREFDFGSNDEIFWLWIRANDGIMWYCRHDQFAFSPVRDAIPIEPAWLIEALGIVEFKPTDMHLGPHRLPDGNWEIVSHTHTPSGQFRRRTVIDHKVGWIVRQELYTPQDELVAMAHVINSRYDPVARVYFARRVEVQFQGMPGKMTIDLGTPTFNRLEPFASDTFRMPAFEGSRAVDIASPELQARGASIQTVVR